MRAPRELAPGVPAVAAVAYGFPLELITNWFLIIQPFDRAAAKVLDCRALPLPTDRFVRFQIVAPDRRERTPETFGERASSLYDISREC